MGKKWTAFTENTAPALADILAMVNDPGGSPLSQKLTVQTLLALAYLSGLTSGYHATEDLMLLIDNGTPKSTTLPNLFAGVEDFLSELSTQPAITDTMLVIDGGVAKFVKKANLFERYFELEPFSFPDQTDHETGNGKASFVIPPDMNGMSLTYVLLKLETAGVTGLLQIQLRNETQAVDMLTTVASVDTTEDTSATAATPYVIASAGNEVVATGDTIDVDVDAIHSGTAGKGMILTVGVS